MKRLFLIDASALIFRAYYAFIKRPMRNRAGMNTSAVWGFVKFLNEIIAREKPEYLGVAFDPRGGSFRKDIDPNYKANRAATPEDIVVAIPYIKRIVAAMNIPVLEVAGYEADDVIGTLAKRAAREGFEVMMVSPDKDFGQLIEEHVKQYKLRSGSDEIDIIGSEQLCEKYGISDPCLVRDILAIWGDSSDNIPGVAGIGEKGAKRLVGEWGTIENIVANVGELPERQRNLIENSAEQMRISKLLATIRTDVPIDCKAEEFLRKEPDTEALKEVYTELDFRSLLARLGVAKSATQSSAQNLFSTPKPKPKPQSKPQTAQQDLFVATTETKIEASPIETHTDLTGLRALMESDRPKEGYDLKNTIKALDAVGIKMGGVKYDVLLLDYLLNPENQHSLGYLARVYLNCASDNEAEIANVVTKLKPMLWGRIVADSMERLYLDIEEPLIEVLADMELTGFKIDMAQLAESAKELNVTLAEIEARIRQMADDETLNVNSSGQLGVVLFEKMHLDPKPKKTKTGKYSTDEEYLQSLSDRSPIIGLILEYRGIKKLLSTYIEALPALVNPTTGRVHTTFNQAVTATGRLSSTGPNLQNIPIRTEQGREIRRSFIPSDSDHVLLSADYSQVELRIMAHLSGDEALISAFEAKEDIHSATASRLFGVPVLEVTPAQRRRAKTANFGIIYGISAFGLKQRMGSEISLSEARSIIEGYFAAYPKVHKYMNSVVEAARVKGYVETIFGRRRYLPDIGSGNQIVRSLAERNAVNAPIQGSAADIIKLAMIAIHREFEAHGLRSKLILQVHDELVVDVLKSELEQVRDIVKRAMEGAAHLRVPLVVDIGVGENWLEAH